MRAVNLLPRDEASGRGAGRRSDPLVIGGAVLTVVVVAGVLGGYLLESSNKGSAQQQLAVAKEQLAQAQTRQHEQQQRSAHGKTPILQVPSVTSQEKPWRDAVASAMSTRIAFDVVLSEFGQVIPSDITLTSLTMTAPSAATAATASSTGGGGQFTLAGTAFSEDSVARLMSRLMLVPDLTGVSLQSSTADPQTGIVTFQIQAQVKGAGSTSSGTPAAGVVS